jgi:hypothetical protein
MPDFQDVRATAATLVDDYGVAAPTLARLRAVANRRAQNITGTSLWEQVAAAADELLRKSNLISPERS